MTMDSHVTFLSFGVRASFVIRHSCFVIFITRTGVLRLDRGATLSRQARIPRIGLSILKQSCSRSEEHTSELQSLRHLVCRLLLDLSSTNILSLFLHDALPIYDDGFSCHVSVIRGSCFFRHSTFVLRHFYHSYRSAATGSRRDAVQAGANPENRPVNIETIMLKIGRAHV